MPDPDSPQVPALYRLPVVVAGVSPSIWRRLLVPGKTTIAGLHTVVQAAFGWSGEHLHRFTVHGADYGISYVGGLGSCDDARTVRLADLGLRERERFAYEYNFTAGWRLDLRVEAIVSAEPGTTCPRCIGGRRAGPPQDWAGPWEFLRRTQPHLVVEAITTAAAIVGRLLQAGQNDELAGVVPDRDELARLLPLLRLECFDRRALKKSRCREASRYVVVL